MQSCSILAGAHSRKIEDISKIQPGLRYQIQCEQVLTRNIYLRVRQTKCQKQTCVEKCSQVPIKIPNASFLSMSCNSKQGLPRKHQGILWGSMGASCHATANGDAAAAQKGAIAKVARQRKIAKVAQLVLNASVYGAGMTCMMIIQ